MGGGRRLSGFSISIGLLVFAAQPAFAQLEDELPVPLRTAEGLLSDGASFTFVRLAYTDRVTNRLRDQGQQDSDRPTVGSWATDYPVADRAFSAQVAELTGLPVDPDGSVMELTDPALSDVPFAYLVEGGKLELRDDEVVALRDYLLGGGFLMIDDFWRDGEWASLKSELLRVLPDRPVLPLWRDHEVFWSYYPLSEMPSVPGFSEFMASARSDEAPPGFPQRVLSEIEAPGDGEPAAVDEPGYYAIFDDDGRLMVLLLHNMDLGDAWEHLGDSRYPRESALGSIALGINTVVYALTH